MDGPLSSDEWWSKPGLDGKRSPLDSPVQLHPTVDAREGSRPEPADVPVPPPRPAAVKVEAFNKGLTPPRLEKPPAPAQSKDDPKGKWSGSATLAASLSGKQVQARWKDAFDAGAAALKSLGQQTQDRANWGQIGRGRTEGKVWQVATENALALAAYQNKAYEEALAEVKKNPTEANKATAKAQLIALSAAFEDPMVKQVMDQRGVEGVDNLQKVRASAVDGTRTATQEIAKRVEERFEKFSNATGRLPTDSEQTRITSQEIDRDPEYQRLLSAGKITEALQRRAALGDDKALEKLSSIEASRSSKEDQRAFQEKELGQRQTFEEEGRKERQQASEDARKDREQDAAAARKEHEDFEREQAADRRGEQEKLVKERNPFDKQGTAKSIADGIENGDQPPVLTGLYGLSAPVRADLEARGIDLSKMQLQWDAAKKQVQSLNGPQQMRFVTLAGSVVNTIDEVKRLSQEMTLSGIPVLNKAELTNYMQLQGNSENGQLAARYIGAVNTLKEEFANLANGGYAPTEASWKLANEQIDSNYGVKELGASLAEIQRLIKYRVDAVPGLHTMGPGAANRYTGATGESESPSSGATPEGAEKPPAGGPAIVHTPADVMKLPSGTQFIIPDGPHKGAIGTAP